MYHHASVEDGVNVIFELICQIVTSLFV